MVWQLALVFLISSSANAAVGDSQARAVQLFKRLTGTPILLNDPRLAKMVAAIDAGDLMGAAQIATNDEHFYSTIVRDFASLMATRSETPLAPLDDFQATIIGAARDDLDARTLLSGDYIYKAGANVSVSTYSTQSNDHYTDLENGRFNLKEVLVKQEPQRDKFPDSAGLLTTRGWGLAHLSGGTNRRGVEFAFREFLCTPIQTWKDPGMPDFHVRRDVDRVPGGNPSTYQTTCRSCHALMDGMGGAYARFDFTNGQLTYLGANAVAPKLNQHANVYPQGYMTLDDSWFNQANQHHNSSFGWRGPLTGKGLREFGAMIANAKKFGNCMTTRVFREVCKREPEPTEADIIQGLADDFEAGGYKLRSLFQRVAVHPACLN